ncbi:MAG: polymer-forming cytoskeletal protein [Leptospiraceae bacterium]|nr:polymer-forming cytoskeletal protein [Leptospiraceae bacterium]MCB1303368.1 polymer-forming cytoskeletal protein [Leptospiraceae bacterium]
MARKPQTSTVTPEIGNIATVFGRSTSFYGILEFEKPLQINGRFEGEILTDGVLVVGEGAVIRANIKAGTVIVGGEITGNIEARTRLEMLHSGRVYGNIRTAKLQIADGVVFDGNCEMIEES